MKAVYWRLAVDVMANTLGLTLVVAAIAALLAAVELAGLGQIPRQIARLVPVLAAMAATRVALDWQRTGRLIALASVGISPARLFVVAGLAALASASLIVGVGSLFGGEVGSQEWTFIGHELAISGSGNGPVLHDVRVAWMEDGQVVGVGTVESARWSDGWTLQGESAQVWSNGVAKRVDIALPSPQEWARARRGGGAVILAERLHASLGGGLLAWIAFPLALRRREVLAVAGAVGWTLAVGIGLALVTTGAISLFAATFGPLAVLAGGAAYFSWRTM